MTIFKERELRILSWQAASMDVVLHRNFYKRRQATGNGKKLCLSMERLTVWPMRKMFILMQTAAWGVSYITLGQYMLNLCKPSSSKSVMYVWCVGCFSVYTRTTLLDRSTDWCLTGLSTVVRNVFVCVLPASVHCVPTDSDSLERYQCIHCSEYAHLGRLQVNGNCILPTVMHPRFNGESNAYCLETPGLYWLHIYLSCIVFCCYIYCL